MPDFAFSMSGKEPAKWAQGDQQASSTLRLDMKFDLPGSFPSPIREIVGKLVYLAPHALQLLVRDSDQLRLVQEAGDGVGREHALGVAQQPGAIGIVGGFRDRLVERVERLRLVADIVVVLRVFDEVERFDMGDDG